MYTLLYADDTLVFAESPDEMQLALDEVGVYCNKWGLSINKTKTKVVIFSKGKVKKLFGFRIGNIDIGQCSEYCYLGVIFNFNGKFNKAIDDRLVPARKAMFGLNQKAVNLLLPPDIHIDLFEKMVTPIFLYGSEVHILVTPALLGKLEQSLSKSGRKKIPHSHKLSVQCIKACFGLARSDLDQKKQRWKERKVMLSSERKVPIE